MTTPTPPRPKQRRSRAVPVSYFVAQCETLARTIAHLKLRLPDGREATMDILQQEWRPQSQRDAYEWTTYFKKLIACHAQRQYGPHSAAAASGPPTAGSASDLRAAFALANEPKRIVRYLPDDEGNPRYLTVYPKSFRALAHIAVRDEALGFLSREVTQLGMVATADALDLYTRAMDEIDRQQRILVWSVAHKGCRLPFEPRDGEPTIPEGILDDLTAVDVVEVVRAHLDVNQRGLMALRTLLGDEAPDGSYHRASWTVFFSNTAAELGIRPEELMEDWSLAEVMTMVRSANSARREAVERVKDKTAA